MVATLKLGAAEAIATLKRRKFDQAFCCHGLIPGESGIRFLF